MAHRGVTRRSVVARRDVHDSEQLGAGGIRSTDGSEAARQVRVFVGFDDWVRARVAGER